MHRRDFLVGGTAAASVALLGLPFLASGARSESAKMFPVRMSEKAWRAELSPEAYAVLREEATERPFTSPLNNEKRAGLFSCAGCDNPLYSSKAKYDSGTGWPSFWEAVDSTAVGTKTDTSLMMQRTEVHCADCGGHLGHIFDDGPQPTGKRHCINGVALRFKAGASV